MGRGREGVGEHAFGENEAFDCLLSSFLARSLSVCFCLHLYYSPLFLLAHYPPSLPLFPLHCLLLSSLQSHLLCLSFFSPSWFSLICHLNLFFLLCASFSLFLGGWEHLGAFQLGSLFGFEDGCDLGCLLRRLFSSWRTLLFPASTASCPSVLTSGGGVLSFWSKMRLLWV